MSTTTAPMTLDVAGTQPVPLLRLAKVEARKALDTRASADGTPVHRAHGPALHRGGRPFLDGVRRHRVPRRRAR